MIIVKTLENTSLATLYQAFKNAFSDYIEPFDATQTQFSYMLERRGYTPELSFGAFIGGTMVGFTLNAVGLWNNKLTAYDTGTATVAGFRRQGIAKKIFNEMMPVLSRHNISQYMLEVIKTNAAAFNLYEKAGFKIKREFNYYISKKKDIKCVKKYKANNSIRVIENPDWDMLQSFWDFYPSWQNSIDAIHRKKEKIIITGAYLGDLLCAYGVIEKHTGDIMQLAVKKECRRRGYLAAASHCVTG